MTIGSRIKDLRKKRGLNQTELGKLFNLNYGAISAIESGRSTPTTELIINLSKLFDVSTDYLLTGKEESSTISSDEQEVIKLYREDGQIREVLKEAIDLKKKVMTQIKMLRRQSMDRPLKTEQA